MPSVVFLDCLFYFLSLTGRSLDILGEYMKQFQSLEKVGFVPQGKTQPVFCGGKNVEQFPQHFDTSCHFVLPPLLEWMLVKNNSNERVYQILTLLLHESDIFSAKREGYSISSGHLTK